MIVLGDEFKACGHCGARWCDDGSWCNKEEGMNKKEMLLSCPFCGAPAEYDSQRWRPPTRPQFTSATGHAIACSACEAEVGLFECFEDAVAAWNRRASLAAVTREREAGRESPRETTQEKPTKEHFDVQPPGDDPQKIG